MLQPRCSSSWKSLIFRLLDALCTGRTKLLLLSELFDSGMVIGCPHGRVHPDRRRGCSFFIFATIFIVGKRESRTPISGPSKTKNSAGIFIQLSTENKHVWMPTFPVMKINVFWQPLDQLFNPSQGHRHRDVFLYLCDKNRTNNVHPLRLTALRAGRPPGIPPAG